MLLDFLRKKPFPPEHVAKKITERIASSSFKLFNDKKFRDLVNFDQLTKTEQDRIFNEIVVNAITLDILDLGSLSEQTKTRFAENFYNETKIELYSYYGNWLRELGTPEEFAGLWKPLIDLRVKEYQKDLKTYRKQIKKTSWLTAWIHIVSLGCLKHIRRGKTKPGDPLFLMLLKWLVTSTEDMTKILDKSI